MLRMSVLEGPMVFVDIETTGMSYSRSRIIEVAAIRVEAGRITSSFSSLVDPQSELPAFITELTGITRSDLDAAPTFYDIADELYNILEGALFVAHNVRFDYGFLKQEFRRAGKTISPKQLCTVRLSKTLYPGVRGHKLQDLIERCGLQATARHRAYDDALAVWLFIQHALLVFPAPVINEAVKMQVRAPSLPKNLPAHMLASLPEGPGVYLFEDESGSPLYIGKSINIRKRVMSHFSADHEHESEFKISQQVYNIETIATGGELEALLLESKLIKDRQPLYNRQLRRHQKMTLARSRTDDNGYIAIDIQDVKTINPDNISDILGVYTTKGQARQLLEQIIKDFGLCPKLMGFEKSRGGCFSYQLKKCRGACVQKESPSDYNQRLLAAFEGRQLQAWPYDSAIIIEELPAGDAIRSLIVDKWCVLADVTHPPDCNPHMRFQETMFDLDTYKILRSYLATKSHKLRIRPVSAAQLDSLVQVV